MTQHLSWPNFFLIEWLEYIFNYDDKKVDATLSWVNSNFCSP